MALVIVAAGAFAQQPAKVQAGKAATQPGPKNAPPFALRDQDGKVVRLADFAGKIVVLEWVNPDCPFVKRHYSCCDCTETARPCPWP